MRIGLFRYNLNEAGCRLRYAAIKDLSKKANRDNSVKCYWIDTNTKDSSLISRIIYKLTKPFRQIYLITSSEIIIFGKPVERLHLLMMAIAKALGKKIISDFCDFRIDKKGFYLKALNLTDAVTCPTTNLALYIQENTELKPILIPDILDPVGLATNNRDLFLHNMGQPLSIIWFGRAGGLDSSPLSTSFVKLAVHLIENRKLYSDQAIEIIIISNISTDIDCLMRAVLHDNNPRLTYTSVDWSEDNIRKILPLPGYAYIPYDEPVEQSLKSANRIELALFYGRKVLSNSTLLPDIDVQLKKYITAVPPDLTSLDFLSFDVSQQLRQINEVTPYLLSKRQRILERWEQLLTNNLNS